MSTSPIAPKVQNGAIISFNIPNPVPTVIAFQYNPDSMTRTITPKWLQDASKPEVLRLSGAPEEVIKADIEIDAIDALAAGDPIAVQNGIHPQLAALEMLVYPSTAVVIANTALLLTGTIEVIPPYAPFTLFVWGPKRVVPVKISDLTIVEEMYDPSLNPVQAKVSLTMKVLSYNDLSVTHPGYGLFLAHQVVKEALATVGAANGLSQMVSGNIIQI
ncbi:MAG: hypothetical protein P4L46_23985 [Fimbriimonas sp.]|nr:hypothetical protein [Fimbriimonas sp.]